MSEQIRENLKGFFKSGSFPVEANFRDLIDSFVSRTEDGLTVKPSGLTIGAGPANSDLLCIYDSAKNPVFAIDSNGKATGSAVTGIDINSLAGQIPAGRISGDILAGNASKLTNIPAGQLEGKAPAGFLPDDPEINLFSERLFIDGWLPLSIHWKIKHVHSAALSYPYEGKIIRNVINPDNGFWPRQIASRTYVYPCQSMVITITGIDEQSYILVQRQLYITVKQNRQQYVRQLYFDVPDPIRAVAMALIWYPLIYKDVPGDTYKNYRCAVLCSSMSQCNVGYENLKETVISYGTERGEKMSIPDLEARIGKMCGNSVTELKTNMTEAFVEYSIALNKWNDFDGLVHDMFNEFLLMPEQVSVDLVYHAALHYRQQNGRPLAQSDPAGEFTAAITKILEEHLVDSSEITIPQLTAQ
jgi:hypothetical protein